MINITQEAAGEVLTIAPTNLTYATGGGEETVAITSNRTWTATSNNAWITVEGAGSGDGDGSIRIAVAVQTDPVARMGTVTIRGGAITRTLNVTQEPADEVLTIAPTNLAYATGGGEETIAITSNRTWTAMSNNAWITVEGTDSGNGDGSIRIAVAVQTDPVERTGTVTIRGGMIERIVTITQEPADEVLIIDSTTLACDATGGGKTVAITSNLTWTATASEEWIQVEGASSLTETEDREVQVQVLLNPSTSERTGTVTIQGGTSTRVINITQEAADEVLTARPTNLAYAAGGGEETVAITSNRTWTATSNDAWITVEGAGSGDGDGSIRIAVAVQTDPVARMGTVTIQGGAITRTLNITQEAADEVLTIAPTNLAYTTGGGEETVAITSNLTWTATSSSTWITIEGAGGGNGNGDIRVVVAAQTDPMERTGTVTIQGGTLTKVINITQDAANEELMVSQTSLACNAAGGGKAVTITSNLTWTATASAGWIQVEGVSSLTGTGDREVQIQALLNASTSRRTGTVTIQGGMITRVINITQEAAEEMLTITPASLSYAAVGGEKTVAITSNLTWTATSNTAWITVEGAGSGDGDGSIRVMVAPRSDPVARAGTVTVRGGRITRTLNIAQDAANEELTIHPTSLTCAAAGGEKSVLITSNITWTATSNEDWITIGGAGSTSKTGNREIIIQVAAQTETTGRTGTITVEGGALTSTLTITQRAAGALTITPTSLAFAAEGGQETVSVESDLSWTTTSNHSWITITEGAAGSGNGSITVQIAAQAATTERTGTVTVQADALTRTLTITQAGADLPDDLEEPVELYIPEGNENASVYPNPTSGLVQVRGLSATEEHTYRLYSIVGQVVKSGRLQRNSIKLDEFSSGQYILVLEDQEGNEALRARLLLLK